MNSMQVDVRVDGLDCKPHSFAALLTHRVSRCETPCATVHARSATLSDVAKGVYDCICYNAKESQYG